MNELDEVWAEMLAGALEQARTTGRQDVADYLALKATNDVIRQTGIKWLFDSLIEIAGEANRRDSGVEIERVQPHNFAHHGANMVGSLIRLRQGVRCLTLEAGWARTPSDGFMRGGALAHAKLTHFGMPKANDEFMLFIINNLPTWKSSTRAESQIDSQALKEHFLVFLG